MALTKEAILEDIDFLTTEASLVLSECLENKGDINKNFYINKTCKILTIIKDLTKVSEVLNDD